MDHTVSEDCYIFISDGSGCSDVMMNYCFVRRDLVCQDPEQTYQKEVVQPLQQQVTAPGLDVAMNNFRPRRSYSETEAHDVFTDVADQDGNFDFYLSVAEEDLRDFGIPFSIMVRERMNLRPCLTEPHIPVGRPKYETMAEFLEERCGGKVVFVLSKNFAASEECQFLVHFAKTLDPFAMGHKLIPLEIDKNVAKPRVLEGLVSINYNAAMKEKWLGKRLWEAIHGNQLVRTQRSFSSPNP